MPSLPKCDERGAGVFRRAGRETAFLLLIALLPAALAGWWHPRSAFRTAPDSGIARVDLATVRTWTGPLLWVDARPAPAFAAAHVPDAVNLTERDWEDRLGDFMAKWRPGVRIVIYCDGAQCHASEGVAKRLKQELQIEEIFVLTGGWEAWQAGVKR
jgi:rhodanese-related sulfurtransferase